MNEPSTVAGDNRGCHSHKPRQEGRGRLGGSFTLTKWIADGAILRFIRIFAVTIEPGVSTSELLIPAMSSNSGDV
jgi:hypothetical protein